VVTGGIGLRHADATEEPSMTDDLMNLRTLVMAAKCRRGGRGARNNQGWSFVPPSNKWTPVASRQTHGIGMGIGPRICESSSISWRLGAEEGPVRIALPYVGIGICLSLATWLALGLVV